MDKDQARRKARYAAAKFANAQWGKDNVLSMALNSVTAWEDPQGYSVWEVMLGNEYVATSERIEVSHAGFTVKLVDPFSASPAKVKESEDGVEWEWVSDRVEVVRRYKVVGAEPITIINTYHPVSVKFTFVDGDLLDTQVYGYLVNGKNGAVSERATEVQGIYSYDTALWPSWLIRLRKQVLAEGVSRK